MSLHKGQGIMARALRLTSVLCVQGDAETPQDAVPSADGVFLHCMSLHKGRGMMARALRLLHAPLATPEGLPGVLMLDCTATCSCWVPDAWHNKAEQVRVLTCSRPAAPCRLCTGST